MHILYHYCDTDAFHSIIDSRAIWLSALSSSNDPAEGRVVAEAMSALATRDGLDEHLKERIVGSLGVLEQLIDGLAFCLSEQGDLLSQWRGYAGNATGVSIGFSVESLRQLSRASQSNTHTAFELEPVVYKPEDHVANVRPVYDEVKVLLQSENFAPPIRPEPADSRSEEEKREAVLSLRKANKELLIKLVDVISKLYLLKSSGFNEEQEWRLLGQMYKGVPDDCEYRSAGARLTPFRVAPLLPDDRMPIAEVILGPKHETQPETIRNFLQSKGFGQVKVRRSELNFR